MKGTNVVFILSDDQGAWALGCAGNKEIITPNLDKLASQGIRFNNFFCTCPVCSPARASILTGKMPSQHGVQDWIRSGNIDYDKLSPDMKELQALQDEVGPIQYLQDQQSYTQVLSDEGYNCGLSGKWHLGDSMVAQQGIDYWEVIAKGGCNYYKSEIIEDNEVLLGEEYITNRITRKAIDFLEHQEDKSEPFYLSIHYTAPHSPWNRENHPEDIWQMYNDCPFESVPNLPQHPWLKHFKDLVGDKRREALQGYYTAVTAMDRGIGEVLNTLEQQGLMDNTLIIFTSDNGMNMGHHGIFGKGNGTFPLNLFDTSVKVPMIMKVPEHITGGRISETMLSHYDIYPTLLEYLDINIPGTYEGPGNSFANILRNQQDINPCNQDIVIYDEYGSSRMIRTQDWKYIHRYPYGPHELYDLRNDPDETKNLVDEEKVQGIMLNLRGRLRKWFLKYTQPDLDGTKSAIMGGGQMNLLNADSEVFK